MTDTDLRPGLRQMHRTVLMLETELRREHLDNGLVAEIEAMMERGIATHERSAGLRDLVDALRETLLTPRPERCSDGVRLCRALRDAIDAILGRMG